MLPKSGLESTSLKLNQNEDDSMWILIFAMYAAPFAETDFASVSSQEFLSKARCEKAKAIFEVKFETLRSINGIAYCVEK
ncbi:hypothetical protein E05_32400 [Plautia stali symbiont]|nr:hypothetical protein E05_32400 [Plautia stali symbiont]